MLSADLPSPPRTSNAPRIFIFTSFLVIGMVAAFMLATSHPNADSSDLMQHHQRRDIWNQWKLHYGKHYHQHEEEHRYGVWNRNFDFIIDHNQEEGHTYKVGLNKFADLERAEYAALYANCLNNVRFNKSGMTASKADLKDLPASVDWRQKNAVTPVKNQQQCGSCWSFSTTGSLEGLHAISEGTLLSFSEQQLVDCSQSYGNQGCNGGLMDDAFKYVAAEGIELESVYPYDAETGKCQYKASAVQFRNADYEDVEQNDSAALQVAAAAHPVSIGIEADTSAFQLYSSGVFNNAGCGTTIDHGVLIVGYGTQNGTPYWIVKNSWGADWGENGYILMERTSEKGAGMCGLAQMASFPTGSSPNPGPNHHEEGEEGNEGGENNELSNKRRH